MRLRFRIRSLMICVAVFALISAVVVWRAKMKPDVVYYSMCPLDCDSCRHPAYPHPGPGPDTILRITPWTPEVPEKTTGPEIGADGPSKIAPSARGESELDGQTGRRTGGR
jgi:hypothetical protein